MEDFLEKILAQFATPIQFMNFVIFFVGISILTWCAKVERKENAQRSDRKEKWAFIDGRKDEALRKRSLRGIFLTIVGGLMALFGIVNLLRNI